MPNDKNHVDPQPAPPRDAVTFRVTPTMKPTTFMVEADMLVVRCDGSVGVVPKGTLIEAPVPMPPFTVEHD